MKINYILLLVFVSAVIYAGVDFSTGITETTLLNGQGCVCHSQNPDQTVNVWIEGPDTLYKGETAEYHIFLTGGPMVKGGFNVAARYSSFEATDPGTQILNGELTHNQPRNFAGDTVSWYFNYTATDSVNWDTVYSVANSVNGDGIPNTADRWNFGANFPVRLLDNIPVELVSFKAVNSDGIVLLSWITATETNNKGFYVERKTKASERWTNLGFVNGKGTFTSQSEYSFSDLNPLTGASSYRLKQVDFNGSFNYSKMVDVNISIVNFSLGQNYPNPFNPTTKIQYNLSEAGRVTLKIYDLTGREVAVLVNESQEAGSHSEEFNASALASGVYIYRLKTDNFSASKKLLLMK